jgi:putative ABC transport system permease protein
MIGTMSGTALGIAAFVAVLGLTATASGQISEDFSVLKATEVYVNDAGQADPDGSVYSFPQDAEGRVSSLAGVRACGVAWPIPGTLAEAVTAIDAFTGPQMIPVTAVSPGYLAALHPTFASGRGLARFEAESGIHAAVLGSAAAQRLGLDVDDAGATVYLAGSAYVVVGILADVERRGEVLAGAAIPEAVAAESFGRPSADAPASMVVDVDPGAAHQVSRLLSLALRPDAPESIAVLPPADPPRVETTVATSMTALFLALTAITVLIGAAAIANATLLSVVERMGELGLRRAMGARPRHIVAQVIAETVSVGALAGLVGASIGTLSVVVASWALEWTPVMDPRITALAPILGAGVGLFAGLAPALRAGRVDPMMALRR